MNKILIVDDSTTMRKIIINVLRQAGFESQCFVEASNGVEGLRAMQANPDVDMVFSDLNMPQMDGVAFVKALRRSHDKEQLPVLMISAESGNSMAQSALEVGANGSVDKPFTPQGMRAALEQYLA